MCRRAQRSPPRTTHVVHVCFRGHLQALSQPPPRPAVPFAAPAADVWQAQVDSGVRSALDLSERCTSRHRHSHELWFQLLDAFVEAARAAESQKASREEASTGDGKALPTYGEMLHGYMAQIVDRMRSHVPRLARSSEVGGSAPRRGRGECDSHCGSRW